MLLKPNRSVLLTFTRNHMKRRNVVAEGGIKYHGFTYYPRFPDQQDPPYTPEKLFLVQRIKPVWGNPWWDKTVLNHLGLVDKMSDYAIVKNIPEVNKMLWRIKHLIKITPIKMPDGVPTEENIHAARLNFETGELRIIPQLAPDQKTVEESEKFRNDPKRLDRHTIKQLYTVQWNRANELTWSDF